jgi:hypothetical protein
VVRRETMDKLEMHKAIMDKVWNLYAQTSAEADWIAMPTHIEKIHDEINELVLEALGLTSSEQ